MNIIVDSDIRLELISSRHAKDLHRLVESDRQHLREWLPWVDHMVSVEQFEKFAENALLRYENGSEVPFVIIYKDKIAGRNGIYNIDTQNRIASIGYWLGSSFLGNGLVTMSTASLVRFAFEEMNLNRIEIRCGTGNRKSCAVPERLHFTREGIIRQGELHNDRFIDLNLYSMLKKDMG